MASVYSQAYVVYSILGSKNDRKGFIAQRECPRYESFKYATASECGVVYVCSTLRERAALSFSDALIRKEPLSQRGWTLQERWLAPRLLHFGSQQVLFECYAHQIGEDGSYVQGRIKCVHQDSPASQVMQDRYGNLPRGSYIWSELIVSYSPRALTNSSDKLPAISGLVDIIKAQTGDDYLAGLWRSNLIEGLLWRTSKPRYSIGAYRAPSWSWASVDGAVGTMNLGASTEDINEWTDIATVLDCQVTLKGRNPFGEVSAGWLKIEGSLATLYPVAVTNQARCTQMKTLNSCAGGGHCLFDIAESQEEALRSCFTVLLLVKCFRRVHDHTTYYGLVVSPVDSSTYRRVGLIVFNREPSTHTLWLNADFRTRAITLV
jgi:hypothetical protein